ncbi:MAG: sulfotransferase [Sulfuricellaceae bacterium]
MDNTPSTCHHPLPVKLINGVLRFMGIFGLAKIDLSEASLCATARRETGLERFGDESFLPGLRVLLNALDSEAHLNPYGRMHAKLETTASLKNRLWANACFEANPEIQQRKITAPIIIVGPVRSGTTRLHRMLATDTRFQHLKAWEGFNPAPRIGWPDSGKAARRDEVEKFLHMGRRLNPDAFAAHPMEADWAEEELLLLNHSFSGLSPLGLYNAPSYCKWFVECDKTPAYRTMANLMKLISWSRGDAENKRWVMKTPQYMLDLDVLIKVFPDAKLVFIHRDPIKTVASTLSLMWNFAIHNTDLPLRGAIRDTWLALCEAMARRCMEVRETLPVPQQLDVQYGDMNRDWQAVMRRVYDFVGLDFTAEAESAMGDWLADSEREGRHRGHRYSLEDFGLSREEVDTRMKFYRERYGIPYEDR